MGSVEVPPFACKTTPPPAVRGYGSSKPLDGHLGHQDFGFKPPGSAVGPQAREEAKRMTISTTFAVTTTMTMAPTRTITITIATAGTSTLTLTIPYRLQGNLV